MSKHRVTVKTRSGKRWVPWMDSGGAPDAPLRPGAGLTAALSVVGLMAATAVVVKVLEILFT